MRIAAQWGYHASHKTGTKRRARYRKVFRCPHKKALQLTGVSLRRHEPGYNWEHTVYESGVSSAVKAALPRVMDQAAALGAHGVLGSLTLEHVDGTANHVAVTIAVTAVARSGNALPPVPFTSNLSGISFAKAISAGCVPVGLVVGIGAVEINPGCMTERTERALHNEEAAQVSEGVTMARKLALEDLEREVATLRGDGCVEVATTTTFHDLSGVQNPGHPGRLVVMLCVGTAVRQFGDMEGAPEASRTLLRLNR